MKPFIAAVVVAALLLNLLSPTRLSAGNLDCETGFAARFAISDDSLPTAGSHATPADTESPVFREGLDRLLATVPAEERAQFSGDLAEFTEHLTEAIKADAADGVVTEASLIEDVAVSLESTLAAHHKKPYSLPYRIFRSFRLKPLCFAIGALVVNVYLLSLASPGPQRDTVLTLTSYIVGSYFTLAFSGFYSIMAQLAVPDSKNRPLHMPWWMQHFIDVSWARKFAYDDLAFDGAKQIAEAFSTAADVANLAIKTDNLEVLAAGMKMYRRVRYQIAPDDMLIGGVMRSVLAKKFGSPSSVDLLMQHLAGMDADVATPDGMRYYQTLIRTWLGRAPSSHEADEK